MGLELSISGELIGNLSQAAVRGVGEGAEDEVAVEGSSSSGEAKDPEEQLLDADGEKTAASAKVVLSEGPFSESETDQSEKEKDCGETNVSSGENKSETEAGEENEARPLAGDSAAQIPQVRLGKVCSFFVGWKNFGATDLKRTCGLVSFLVSFRFRPCCPPSVPGVVVGPPVGVSALGVPAVGVPGGCPSSWCP